MVRSKTPKIADMLLNNLDSIGSTTMQVIEEVKHARNELATLEIELPTWEALAAGENHH